MASTPSHKQFVLWGRHWQAAELYKVRFTVTGSLNLLLPAMIRENIQASKYWSLPMTILPVFVNPYRNVLDRINQSNRVTDALYKPTCIFPCKHLHSCTDSHDNGQTDLALMTPGSLKGPCESQGTFMIGASSQIIVTDGGVQWEKTYQFTVAVQVNKRLFFQLLASKLEQNGEDSDGILVCWERTSWRNTGEWSDSLSSAWEFLGA